MASVVFFRAVNVGGFQKFQPGLLAKKLADLGVVNVGAAGTFVVRKMISQSALRAEILDRLPFQPELMIFPASEVTALVYEEPFGTVPKDARPFVTVVQKPPRKPPAFPFEQPTGSKWQVRVIGARGRFALSLWRRHDRAIVYPNAVVEKYFGVAATTRSWNTIQTVSDLLAE
jgi:uncharacterized protein (DUF1697 family)